MEIARTLCLVIKSRRMDRALAGSSTGSGTFSSVTGAGSKAAGAVNGSIAGASVRTALSASADSRGGGSEITRSGENSTVARSVSMGGIGRADNSGIASALVSSAMASSATGPAGVSMHGVSCGRRFLDIRFGSDGSFVGRRRRCFPREAVLRLARVSIALPQRLARLSVPTVPAPV